MRISYEQFDINYVLFCELTMFYLHAASKITQGNGTGPALELKAVTRPMRGSAAPNGWLTRAPP